jgi:tRNA threonylcarbamoyl adenosine modification protein (Sua5/YciO/YrdC/YwlC family)
MLLHIHPDNPEERKIRQVVSCLREGGVIVYPTDTIYGLGCDFRNPRAFERICRIKGVRPEKAQFSFVCSDLGHLADFTKPIGNSVFKLMRRVLPGPFTFILNASNEVPKMLKTNKKTVGIRVPDHAVARAIVKELGHPIVSTSLRLPDDEVLEYPTDPDEMYEAYGKLVDLVVHSGYGGNVASTVVDCTDEEPVVVRQGAGIL